MCYIAMTYIAVLYWIYVHVVCCLMSLLFPCFYHCVHLCPSVCLTCQTDRLLIFFFSPSPFAQEVSCLAVIVNKYLLLINLLGKIVLMILMLHFLVSCVLRQIQICQLQPAV